MTRLPLADNEELMPDGSILVALSTEREPVGGWPPRDPHDLTLDEIMARLEKLAAERGKAE